MSKRNKPATINPQISETLVEFARPIFKKYNIPSEREALETSFMVAVTVWNSIILDKINSSNRYRTELLIRAATGPDGLNDFVDELTARKNKFYSNDMRLISNQMVSWKNGDLCVTAEARVDSKAIDSASSDMANIFNDTFKHLGDTQEDTKKSFLDKT